MKKFKLISIMLSAALFSTMFNFAVSAEETNDDAAPNADNGTRIAYEQNFDNCDWFDNDAISGAASGKFEKKYFSDYLNDTNTPTTYKLENVTDKASSETDKSLHINAKFTIPFSKKADGTTDADWWTDPGDTGYNGAGNNGVSHRMIVQNNDEPQFTEDNKYIHISFSAAQDPMPKWNMRDGQGSGLQVSVDFVTKKADGNGQATNLRLMEWCNENRRQRVFESKYEAGVPDTNPMSANKWIKYDYVFHTTASKRTLDIYLNGYPVIKNLDVTNEIKNSGNPSQIRGVKKLNFQVRDMNTGGDGNNQRSVDVYIDDVKVTYADNAPVISPQSVFGDAAHINASEKYVDNETGVIYNYGQSLDDMKRYFPGKNVYIVAKKTGGAKFDNFWTTRNTNSLDSVILQGDNSIANPALCVEDGSFFYCYEIRQPKATNLKALITETDGGAALTWSGEAENCKKVEIFKDGVKVGALDKGVNSYSDAALTADTAHEYRIRELLSDNDASIFVAPRLSDGTTVVYAENFDNRTWWEEGGETPTVEQFARTPFFKYLDENDGQNMTSAYELKSGANGRETDDKSLHLNATFKLPFGKQSDGTTNANNSTDDGLWVANDEKNASGNNGVSHRMMANSQAMANDDQYLHVSFSAAQDPMPPTTIGGEQSAGLDVSFDFMTENGNKVANKEMLHWYSGAKQGVFGTFYQVRTRENGWVHYDYVFDTANKTVDIYVNGYPTVKGKTIGDGDINGTIKGISKLNFQVRDMEIDAQERDVHAYVDDIKVTYGMNAPVVSPYSIFGEAAEIKEAGKYVDNEAGIVYNYGQSLSQMEQLINAGGGNKKVYLVKESADSRENWQLLEVYESESLDAVKLNDGRVVSPILYVENGSFTYRYQIVQTISYDAATKTALIKSEKDYDEAVVVIFAGYQDGVLMASNLQTATLRRGDNSVTAGEGFDTSGVNEIRIMVWDSIGSLRPLYGGWQLK